MPDIIQLLPDSIANQIAAGEVIQRPASVIKELVENSIDAGSDEIAIHIIDAGRTLIQVSDNGMGMSDTDARLSFERHATSKIKTAADLFNLHTKGFRGEALASIAAISDVELKTKKRDEELGTHIQIKGSEFIFQEPAACSNGSTFLIKNLFYNVPARRKFLKSNATELRHIVAEFQRIALAHEDVFFSLSHNQSELYNLPKGSLSQRIVHLFGKNIKQNLIPLETQTSIVKLKGFIGKPEHAKKTYGEQFFFVNQRFMRHPYFHKAVSVCFDKLMPQGHNPSYFIFLDVEADSIDINIHPTKTEIKFEHESEIFQILQASVREVLGKYNLVPSIDFNTEGLISIPVPKRDENARLPGIDLNQDFNPFENLSSEKFNTSFSSQDTRKSNSTEFKDWQKLYSEKNTLQLSSEQENEELFPQTEKFERQLFQFKNKYILSPVKSGMMFIHQHRAHERILYERYSSIINSGKISMQKLLFPELINLSPEEFTLLSNTIEELRSIGFELSIPSANQIEVSGIPGYIEEINTEDLIYRFLDALQDENLNLQKIPADGFAKSMAKSCAIKTGKTLKPFEMQQIVDELFACNLPNISPDNRMIISILKTEELDKRFN